VGEAFGAAGPSPFIAFPELLNFGEFFGFFIVNKFL
jgi:hypothetical protein